MRRVLIAVIEYLLGFLALAFFAVLAFASPNPTDERLLFAFKAATPVAVAELAFLCWRPTPANRLILGANFWLVAGGLAAWSSSGGGCRAARGWGKLASSWSWAQRAW